MKCQISFSEKNKKNIPKEIICIKYQSLFSGKNKKKCHQFITAEFSHRTVMFKFTLLYSQDSAKMTKTMKFIF